MPLVPDLTTILGLLTPRQEQIIRLRVLCGLTYREIGQQFAVTRERIRQIERKAMTRLQDPNFLRSYGRMCLEWEIEHLNWTTMCPDCPNPSRCFAYCIRTDSNRIPICGTCPCAADCVRLGYPDSCPYFRTTPRNERSRSPLILSELWTPDPLCPDCQQNRPHDACHHP